MSAIVEVRDLVKTFGDVLAVDGVGFEIAEGELFGLLGPNGAGKTTTISAISCLLQPDSGTIRVDGNELPAGSLKVRQVLGVVPQEIALYPTLTAAENLRFWGRMYGLVGKQLADAVDYGLSMAGLEDKAKKRVETFSGGMKRRINIAAGVLHRPKVLLMDEPTVGIDPQSRNHILDTVRALNREGMTVLYTSHYMEEVEALCDRVAIVDHGKVIADGTLEQLRATVGDTDVIRVRLLDEQQDASETGEVAPPAAKERPLRPEMRAGLEAAASIPGVAGVEALDGTLEIQASDAASVLGPLVASLSAAGVSVKSLEVTEPDLESVFLHLTGRGLRD